jgi:hypothetical protein
VQSLRAALRQCRAVAVIVNPGWRPLELMRDTDFRSAIDAFRAGAASVLSGRPVGATQHVYAA